MWDRMVGPVGIPIMNLLLYLHEFLAWIASDSGWSDWHAIGIRAQRRAPLDVHRQPARARVPVGQPAVRDAPLGALAPLDAVPLDIGEATGNWRYRVGRGVEASDELAVAWFRCAVEQGDAPAMDHLGWMLKEA